MLKKFAEEYNKIILEAEENVSLDSESNKLDELQNSIVGKTTVRINLELPVDGSSWTDKFVFERKEVKDVKLNETTGVYTISTLVDGQPQRFETRDLANWISSKSEKPEDYVYLKMDEDSMDMYNFDDLKVVVSFDWTLEEIAPTIEEVIHNVKEVVDSKIKELEKKASQMSSSLSSLD